MEEGEAPVGRRGFREEPGLVLGPQILIAPRRTRGAEASQEREQHMQRARNRK